MRTHHYRKILAVLIIGLFMMQLSPVKPVSAAVDEAYYSEISGKLETMAHKYNIPPVLLKAIAYMESGWGQYKPVTETQPLPEQPWDGTGIGIMQVTPSALNPYTPEIIERLKTDIDYNIEEGCKILNKKWLTYPKIGDGDRNVLENWYFAVWGYNNWAAMNNPNVVTGKSAYQDSIFSLMGQKYLTNVITFAPGATKIPKSLLPLEGTPSLASCYTTPTTTHKGDLVIDSNSLLSSGGSTGTDSANGDYWYNYGRKYSYYALGFYITAYNSPLVTDKAIVKQKILSSYNNLLAEADALALEDDAVSTKTAAKYYWTVLQGPNLDAVKFERATKGYQATNDPNSDRIVRLGGTDQYETAAKIAAQGWTTTSDNAILAPGMTANRVDALAAGPLAAKLKAPILLTEGGKLNPLAKAELVRLKVQTVYVVSGLAVIQQGVLDELNKLPNVKVVFLGGDTQYDTAINIAKNMGAFTQIAVATGDQNNTPADALSVASIAGAQGMPILLTEKGALPDRLKTYLDSVKANITESYIIGGTGVIADTVKAQLPGTVHRYFGNTAYDTNVEVLKKFDSVLKYDHVFVANGETTIDALAGAPLAAKYHAGIVLTHQALNEGTSYVRTKESSSSIVTGLGGLSVIPDSVLKGLVYQP